MTDEIGLRNIAFWVTAIACAPMVSWIFRKYREKLSAELRTAADSMGLSFSKKGREITFHKHCDLDVFSYGDHIRIDNEIWGNWKDVNISVFEVRYIEDSNNGKSSSSRIAISIDITDKPTAQFQLKQEYDYHKIGQIFGYQDIDFPEFTDFSKNYLLRGDNENEIRQLFSPQVIKYFELFRSVNFESFKHMGIESDGNVFVFHKPLRMCAPDELEKFLDEGVDIYRVLFG